MCVHEPPCVQKTQKCVCMQKPPPKSVQKIPEACLLKEQVPTIECMYSNFQKVVCAHVYAYTNTGAEATEECVPEQVPTSVYRPRESA